MGDMKARIALVLLFVALPLCASAYTLEELVQMLGGGPPPWESARSVDVKKDLMRALGYEIPEEEDRDADQEEDAGPYADEQLEDATSGALDFAEMFERLREMLKQLDFLRGKAVDPDSETEDEEDTEDETPDETEEDVEDEEEPEEDEQQEEEEEIVEPSCELASTPESIIVGDDATLSWTTQNASSAVLVTFGEVSLTGTRTVSPNETAEYILRVKGATGEGECTVEVAVEEVAEPSLELSVDPDIVGSGETSTISWSAENVFACSLTGGGFSEEALSGSRQTGELSEDTTFTLTCVSRTGPAEEEVTVVVEEEQASGPLRSLASAAPSLASFRERVQAFFSALIGL